MSHENTVILYNGSDCSWEWYWYFQAGMLTDAKPKQCPYASHGTKLPNSNWKYNKYCQYISRELAR